MVENRLHRDDAPVAVGTHYRCVWEIPGLPADLQPSPTIRAAYWFAVTLTDDYGWKLSEIGHDTAARGFIADIAGETIAIFPASMSDDRTAASALARLLGNMSIKDAVIVAALVKWHTDAHHPSCAQVSSDSGSN